MHKRRCMCVCHCTGWGGCVLLQGLLHARCLTGRLAAAAPAASASCAAPGLALATDGGVVAAAAPDFLPKKDAMSRCFMVAAGAIGGLQQQWESSTGDLATKSLLATRWSVLKANMHHCAVPLSAGDSERCKEEPSNNNSKI